MKSIKRFTVLLCLVEIIGAANIFVMIPTASFSHQQFYHVYVRELHKRGHNITVATANPINDPSLTNLREIDMGYQYGYIKSLLADASSSNSIFRIFPELFLFVGGKIVLDTCKLGLEDDNLMSIYRNNEKFDLVIFEWGIHYCYYPFEKLSDGKYIGIGSYAMGALTHYGMGNPVNPAYFPDYSLSYSDRMNFFERLRMSLFDWVCFLYFSFIVRVKEDALAREYFGQEIRPLWKIENDVALVFENTHPLVTYPKPNNLNLIPIGGPAFHLFGRKPKKLPKDIQDFMDDAKDGVIYFSLGSNVKTGDGFDREEKILIECFSKIKQKVLWKWENENLEVNLTNVKISKWFPQVDILAHPNIKAFVTQGGLQSIGEAVSYHIPLIVMPFFADQGFNAVRMQLMEAAIVYDFDDLSVDGFSKALHEIIYNTTYKKNIEKLSNLVKDQPIHPLEKAIWWTEYVIRHNGAPHLRSVAATMPWYQYFMLDVLAAAFFILLLLSYLIYKIFVLLIRVTCKREKFKRD